MKRTLFFIFIFLFFPIAHADVPQPQRAYNDVGIKILTAASQKNSISFREFTSEQGKSAMKDFDAKAWESFFNDFNEEVAGVLMITDWRSHKWLGVPAVFGLVRKDGDEAVLLVLTSEKTHYVFQDVARIDTSTFDKFKKLP